MAGTIPVQLRAVTNEIRGLIIYPDGKRLRAVQWNNTFGIPSTSQEEVDFTALFCNSILEVRATAHHTSDLRRYIPENVELGNNVDPSVLSLLQYKNGATLYKVGACIVIVPDKWATNPIQRRSKAPAKPKSDK